MDSAVEANLGLDTIYDLGLDPRSGVDTGFLFLIGRPQVAPVPVRLLWLKSYTGIFQIFLVKFAQSTDLLSG